MLDRSVITISDLRSFLAQNEVFFLKKLKINVDRIMIEEVFQAGSSQEAALTNDIVIISELMRFLICRDFRVLSRSRNLVSAREKKSTFLFTLQETRGDRFS